MTAAQESIESQFGTGLGDREIKCAHGHGDIIVHNTGLVPALSGSPRSVLNPGWACSQGPLILFIPNLPLTK